MAGRYFSSGVCEYAVHIQFVKRVIWLNTRPYQRSRRLTTFGFGP